ncbi:hypothetical protein [Oceanicola sp. S124]|uniref:hypothetical protein n=1 Tax=Oceanicola sp. S124 TaxID=1042378 RepID=UPI0002559C81|nr:hypothetical protein [Oceanicola sp. S124]
MKDFADQSHRQLVLSAADELEAMVAGLTPFNLDDYEASRRRQREELRELKHALETRRDAPAKISEGITGVFFSMLGFRASSTSGLPSAIRNWIVQVRQKAGARGTIQ